jgi:hypothetical protein
MKKVLSILLLSCGTLWAAHLSFDMSDLGQSAISQRRVYVHPESTPRAESGEIITSDSKTFVTTTNGTYTLSNVVQGVYRIEIIGPTATPPKPNTIFRITVPDTNIVVEVDTLITVNTNLPSSLMAYSQQASDARYFKTNWTDVWGLVSLSNRLSITAYTNTAQPMFTNVGVIGAKTVSSNMWIHGRTFRYSAAGEYTSAAVGTNTVTIHIGSEALGTGEALLRNNSGTFYPWRLEGAYTVGTNGAAANWFGIATLTLHTNASMGESWPLSVNSCCLNTTTNNPLEIKFQLRSSGGAATEFVVHTLGVKVEY